jgi:integrase
MLTRAQARAALQAAERKDPELYLFLRLEATTGLRPGEVCALWWQDFDLDAGDLIVGYNVVHAKDLPGGYVRKRTKSRRGDDRPIALGETTTQEAKIPSKASVGQKWLGNLGVLRAAIAAGLRQVG